MTIENRESRSISGLLADLLRESRDLFQTEARLIRSEISDKVAQIQTAGMVLIGAVICILVSLIILSQALILALAEFVSPTLAAVIVGLAFALIAIILFARAKSNLKPANLVPTRTVNQLNKDGRLVKEHLP